jgi:hypothetical protein
MVGNGMPLNDAGIEENMDGTAVITESLLVRLLGNNGKILLLL